ncbi:hypothetical protein KKE26_12565 [bacterium]|nr:hypothetical protein [bacterium]
MKKQIPLAKGIPTADCQAAAAIRRVSSSTKFKLMPHNLILSYGRGNKQKRTGTSTDKGNASHQGILKGEISALPHSSSTHGNTCNFHAKHWTALATLCVIID